MKNIFFRIMFLCLLIIGCLGRLQAQEKIKIGMLVADGYKTNVNYSQECHARFMTMFDETLFEMTEVTVTGSDSQWGQLTEPEDKNHPMVTRFAEYDLLMVHPSVGGRVEDMIRFINLVGEKPILNIKPFAYTTGTGNNDRWGW